MDHRASAFLATVEASLPAIAGEADAEDGFPRHGMALLRMAGALEAALPAAAGGLDLGCGRQGAAACRFFRLLGRGSVSVGRLLEGHVNALRLVFRYGTAEQREHAAAAARDGKLFGIWVTDASVPLGLRAGGLAGGKAFCSGAGHVARALVTAEPDRVAGRTPERGGESSMYLVDVGEARPGAARTMSGVRGAVTADMALDGLPAGDPVGEPGAYLRQPEFSAGAWRGSAVACGALEALVGETIRSLRERGRHRNPHQAARLGRLMIARDAAILWADRAAEAADGTDADEVVATVNLARLAVEAACLDAIPLVQRSVGLAAMLAGSRTDRMIRDLATYLRQPAPDETLTEAAIWFAENAP